MKSSRDPLGPDSVAAWYRATPAPSAAARARVLRSVSAGGSHRDATRGRRRAWAIWSGRSIAAAAAVVLVTLATNARAPRIAVADAATAPVRIELHAPAAQAVALVGDFNEWSRVTDQMRHDPEAGVWHAEVTLAPGRHAYAFVVDGTRWTIDPRAPQAAVSDFGATNVVLVASR